MCHGGGCDRGERDGLMMEACLDLTGTEQKGQQKTLGQKWQKEAGAGRISRSGCSDLTTGQTGLEQVCCP